VRYAETYGARGHRPASAAAFAPLLAETLDQPGVDLIEVPIDYSDNDRILNHEIRELSARI
jgi:acetolactate synthase I/II/III large subunit